MLLRTLATILGSPDHWDREWANFDCPFCGGKRKFGVNTRTHSSYCFKCESRPWIGDLLRKHGHQLPPLRSKHRPLRQSTIEFEPLDLQGWVRLPSAGMDDHARRLYDYAVGRGADPEVWEFGTLPSMPERVVFLIRDGGIAVSYQARAVHECMHPKTLNPPKTHGVEKSELLYGLDHVRSGDLVIVTEGVFDAITAHDSKRGTSGVALLGKDSSTQQLHTLSQLPNEVIIALDRDARKNAVSLAIKLQELGKNVRVVEWDDSTSAKDANEAGCEVFLQLVKRATTVTHADLVRATAIESLQSSSKRLRVKRQSLFRRS